MPPSKRHVKGAKHSQPSLRPRQTRSRGKAAESDPTQNTQQLTEQLRALGLYPAETLGDGNCLFRALSDQLYGTPSHHVQLRRDICDWIDRHRERYAPFCEDERGLDVHLQCMRQLATYGGHMELSAFAHMTGRDVKVIQPGLVYVIESSAFADTEDPPEVAPSTPGNDETQFDSKQLRKLKRERVRADKARINAEKEQEILRDATPDLENLGPVYVAYHDWEHFSSIRNLRGPHIGLPMVQERPGPPVDQPAPLSPKASRNKSPSIQIKPQRQVRAASKPTSSASLLSLAESVPPSSQASTVPPSPPLTPCHVPLPASRSPSPLPTLAQHAVLDSLPLQGVNSPKRTFDESSCSSEEPSASDPVGKRSRHSPEEEENAHVDTGDGGETPALSRSANSSTTSSPMSSPPSTPPPTLRGPPMTSPERTLTRRQRKRLGLPKQRSAVVHTAGSKRSAGRIVIPGGRFKRNAADPAEPPVVAPVDASGEWQTNGAGRMDVRGFRELKI